MKATEKDDSDDQRRRVTSLTWQLSNFSQGSDTQVRNHASIANTKDAQTLFHGFIHSIEDGDDDNDGEFMSSTLKCTWHKNVCHYL
jgi:hypothetical protein